MKRILACIVALMICAAMVLPAAASTFTPSVTYKDAPQIVPVPGVSDAEGRPALGETWKDDIFFEYMYEGCLVITSVADAPTSTDIPEDARDLLLDVYEKLCNGEMKLPYEQLGLKASDMVIRDLFDASFLCGDGSFDINHPEMLEPDGVTIKLTFNIGAGKSDKIYAMAYIDGQWQPVDTKNNKDGTVTCVFEQLCPVVFCADTSEGGSTPGGDTPGGNTPGGNTPGTGDVSMIQWIVIASVSLLAIGVLVVIYRTKFSKK